MASMNALDYSEAGGQAGHPIFSAFRRSSGQSVFRQAIVHSMKPPTLTPFARVFAISAVCLTASCGLEQTATQDPVMALEACIVEGVRGDARCGTLEVAENRADPAGRKITLHYAIMPAKVRSKALDPVFVLAGGPGQSAIGVAGNISPVFAKLNEKRDIVFLDQRGTGESNPLDCEIDEDEPLSGVFDTARQQALLKQCLASLKGDPRFYTTSIAVQDLDAVRAKLAYPSINLWGASYGTRVALEYMRRYPNAVRSVVLDGVAPTNMKLPVTFAADGWQALSTLLQRCEADENCRYHYPQLQSRLTAFLDKLGSGRMTVEFVHPVTGNVATMEMEEMAIRMAVFRPLYLPQLTSLLPGALHHALEGQFEPLIAQNLIMTSGAAGELATGMHLAVICAEDVAPITDADRAQLQSQFFGRAVGRAFLDACAVWPRGEVPKDYAEPVKSNAPVLIFSGGRDPATPPRHGEAVAKHLPNARHFVAPELGHGVSSTPCATDMITRFFREPTTAKLDGECLQRLPALPIRLPMREASAALKGDRQ
jgi:pimeloyl-ACP methyl ester carboxylesterase